MVHTEEVEMAEIVKRVAEAAPRERGAGGGLGMDASVHVKARSAGGHKKVAEAWAEVGGTDLSRWRIYCDEGAQIGGEDSAPPPLVYFGAAIAF